MHFGFSFALHVNVAHFGSELSTGVRAQGWLEAEWCPRLTTLCSGLVPHVPFSKYLSTMTSLTCHFRLKNWPLASGIACGDQFVSGQTGFCNTQDLLLPPTSHVHQDFAASLSAGVCHQLHDRELSNHLPAKRKQFRQSKGLSYRYKADLLQRS